MTGRNHFPLGTGWPNMPREEHVRGRERSDVARYRRCALLLTLPDPFRWAALASTAEDAGARQLAPCRAMLTEMPAPCILGR